MIDRGGKRKSNWRLALAVVLWALLACGLLISLAVRKVAVEKKVEQEFMKEETMGKTAPEMPTRPDPDYQ